MADVKISVLTPVYNHRIEYVKECFESLHLQTFLDIEFIIIDNGSNPETKELIGEYLNKDKRFRVITLEQNQGYGKAMNIGIKEAKGTYIGTVESDDFIDPVMYEKLYNLIYSDSIDIAKISFMFYSEDTDKCKIGRRFPTEKCNKILKNVDIPEIALGHASQWCAIYKRQMLLDNDIFYSETPGATHQDMPFVLKTWFSAKNIVVMNNPLYHYRIDNPNQSTHQKDTTPWGSHIEYQLLTKYMEEHISNMKPEYWHIKARREYGNKIYFYTEQITKDKYKYLKNCMSKVFKQELKKGRVDFSYFNKQQKKEYQLIAKHPLLYYIKTFIESSKIYSYNKNKTHRIYYILGFKLSVKIKPTLKQILNESLKSLHNENADLKKLILNQNTQIQATMLHPYTFAKYRNYFAGKDVVLVCTGPTAKNYEPIPGAIHIGVNGAIYLEKINLDYLFIQDNTIHQLGNERLNIDANNYRPDTCKKFYGIIASDRLKTIKRNIERIPLSYANHPNISQYILEDIPCNNWAYDLSREPIGDFFGTPFSAMQFILYANPKKIYLVGCDCSNGYAYNNRDNYIPVTGQKTIWIEQVKPYIENYFKDTEIISINPVGLKGLFKDLYTDSYLSENSDLDLESAQILLKR